jgi:hypothetical protein
MADYPLTRALLMRLLGLGPEDAQLPLELLVNLHRVQLRTPLQVAGRLGSAEGTPAKYGRGGSLLGRRFPPLRDGYLFMADDALAGVRHDAQGTAAWFAERVAYRGDRVCEALLVETGVLVGNGYAPWSPALYLHELTLGPASLTYGLTSLEIALGLHPVVGVSLLHLPAMTPAQVAALTPGRAHAGAWVDRVRGLLPRPRA